MNKTVLQKLTTKYPYNHVTEHGVSFSEDIVSAFRQESALLKQAAQDLLSPRPEAISRLLEMSRSV